MENYNYRLGGKGKEGEGRIEVGQWMLVRSGLGLEGRLVVALEHGLSILAEGVEVLSQYSAASDGFRLVDLHL